MVTWKPVSECPAYVTLLGSGSIAQALRLWCSAEALQACYHHWMTLMPFPDKTWLLFIWFLSLHLLHWDTTGQKSPLKPIFNWHPYVLPDINIAIDQENRSPFRKMYLQNQNLFLEASGSQCNKHMAFSASWKQKETTISVWRKKIRFHQGHCIVLNREPCWILDFCQSHRS